MKLLTLFFNSEPSGDAGLALLAVIATLLVGGGLIALLLWRTKYTRMYFIDVNTKKRIFNKAEMRKSLGISIILKGDFYLFGLTIRGYKDLVSLYGESNLNEAVGRIIDRIDTETSTGTRISNYEPGKILVYFKAGKDFKATAMSKTLKDLADRKSVLSNGATINIDVTIAIAHFPTDADSVDGIIGCLEMNGVSQKFRQPTKNANESDKQQADRIKEQHDLEDIRKALADNEFCLYYHPIVETRTLKVIGAESLIRWKHPTRGMLPPSSFLPILERTGEMYKVGLWIFEEAAKQLLDWRTKGYGNFWISVNLSLNQLHNADIIKEFSRILRKYNLEASDFFLEIYDISVYSRVEVAKTVIDKFAQLGFNMSVDKFGRGTSSLTELANLPLAQIKVDMPFIEHAKENLLYSGVINALTDYVKQSNIMLVADGVETQEQLLWARQNGLEYLQGFFFSRPVDANEFLNKVMNKTWSLEASEQKKPLPETEQVLEETLTEQKPAEQEVVTKPKKQSTAKQETATDEATKRVEKAQETTEERPEVASKPKRTKKSEEETTEGEDGSITTKRKLSISKESSFSHITKDDK